MKKNLRKNTAPFNWETRDEFTFRAFESDLVSRVVNIFKTGQGIYVLYGVRGMGKTSIKNYAQSLAEKDGYGNKKVFINIPFYTDDNDLYKYMLEQLLCSKYLEKFWGEIKQISAIFEKEISSENILSNSIKETSDRTKIEENKGEIGGGFAFSCFNIMGKKSKSRNREENSSESYAKQDIQRSLYIPTPQDKKKRVLHLLKKIQQECDIIIIIDELDKLSNIEIGQLVEGNKMLFLDSKTTILLIADLVKGMHLKRYLAEYIKDFILYRSFDFYEYIVKSENIGNTTGYQFLSLLDDYYMSHGNNRELTYMRMRGSEGNIKSLCGIMYFLFQSTNFYIDLPEDYREVFRLLWGKLLENAWLLKGLSLQECNELAEEFIANNNIDNVTFRTLFKRFEELVIKKKLRISKNAFYPYFQNWEDSADFFQKIMIEYNMLVNEEGYFLQGMNNTGEFSLSLARFLKEFDLKEEEFVQLLKKNAGLKKSDDYISSNSKLRILRDADTSQGVYHAEKIIKNLRNEILGVVVFYPLNRKKEGDWYEKPLRNGFVYRKNPYGEILCYPYVGFIGFHSHKPEELKGFIEFLNKEEVPFYEVSDIEEEIWDECFEKEGEEEKKAAILNLCENYGYVEEWLHQIPRI